MNQSIKAALYAMRGRTIIVDCETDGLYWYMNSVIGIGIYCPSLDYKIYINTADYMELPFGKPKVKKVWNGAYYMKESTGRKNKLYEDQVIQATRLTAVPNQEAIKDVTYILRELGNDPKTCFINHNIKFDLHFLGLNPYTMPCMILDTMVMVHLYDSRLIKSLDRCERLFLHSASKRSHVSKAPKGLAKKPWLWPQATAADYCLNDCIVTYQLYQVMLEKLRKAKLIDLFKTDMLFLRALWVAENRGIRLDKAFCLEGIATFKNNLNPMARDLYDSVGYEFNWRSTQQLSKAIYQNLGIPIPVDDTGSNAKLGKNYNALGTSAMLLKKHPIGSIVMDLRETDRFRANAEKWLELSQSDGVLHTNFKQTGTLTGRSSSNEPNFQNVPGIKRNRQEVSKYTGGSKRENAYNMRKAFTARPGYTFISLDHKQQEARLFAVIAKEQSMLQALRDRVDIHLFIAILVWGDCGPELNDLHRSWAKKLSFGILYGMGIASIVMSLEKSYNEAMEIINAYFDRFPGIRPYMDYVGELARRKGYVRYWSGRLWRQADPDKAYIAVNALVQGGAADLLKLAFIRVQRAVQHNGWGVALSIIHDEIIVEVENQYIDQAVPVLAKIMELEDIFKLPFSADVAIGKNYGELKDIEVGGLDGINWLDFMPYDFDLSAYSLIPYKYGSEYKPA